MKVFNEDIFWRLMGVCIITLVSCGTLLTIYGTFRCIVQGACG